MKDNNQTRGKAIFPCLTPDSIHAEQLKYRFNSGEAMKFVHFWGHQPSRDSSVTAACLSQWYAARFTVDGITYATAEHYMMAAKARLFKDQEILSKIIKASNPGAAKALGREVKNFDQEQWFKERFRLVCEGNFAKFSQNLGLQEFLLRTGKKILVEASPVDCVWGIGLAANDPGASNPNLWKGLNLLGFALMQVRAELAGTMA